MPEFSSPVSRLNELIRGIQFAMMTTVRPDGSLHSCPMVTQEADSEGVLWFFTKANTEKVEAIRTDSRVCLSYADPQAQSYVSITGHAELVRDSAKNRQLWKDEYSRYFTGGVNNSDLILIRVLVLSAEYWNAPEGRMSGITGFGKEIISNRNYGAVSYREIEFKENQKDRNR